MKMCLDVRAAAATLPNNKLGALPALLPELMCRSVRELARPPTGSPCISAAVSNSPHHVLTLCSPNTVMTASLCLFKTRRGMLWFAEAFGVVPSPTHKHNPESDSRSFSVSLSSFILSFFHSFMPACPCGACVKTFLWLFCRVYFHCALLSS